MAPPRHSHGWMKNCSYSNSNSNKNPSWESTKICEPNVPELIVHYRHHFTIYSIHPLLPRRARWRGLASSAWRLTRQVEFVKHVARHSPNLPSVQCSSIPTHHSVVLLMPIWTLWKQLMSPGTVLGVLMLHCTVLYCTVLYWTVLCRAWWCWRSPAPPTRTRRGQPGASSTTTQPSSGSSTYRRNTYRRNTFIMSR